jgi:hypothetical protein
LTNKSLITNKIKNLANEKKQILVLIKDIQVSYFEDRTISLKLYKLYLDRYRKRIANIEQNIMNLELKKLKLLKKSKDLKFIQSQEERIINVMKSLQEDYFIKRIIDKESYRKMFYQYNKIYASLKQSAKEEDIKIAEKKSGEQKHEIEPYTKRHLVKKNILVQEIRDPNEYFYVCDGTIIKSFDDFIKKLREMNDLIFSYHVNDRKNDFSNWIDHVFEDRGLANRIKNITKREEMLNMISIYMEHKS